MGKKILVLTGSPRVGGNSDLLAAAFVEKYSAEMGKQVAGVAPEVTAFLMNRSWRGNVRIPRTSLQYKLEKYDIKRR